MTVKPRFRSCYTLLMPYGSSFPTKQRNLANYLQNRSVIEVKVFKQVRVKTNKILNIKTKIQNFWRVPLTLGRYLCPISPKFALRHYALGRLIFEWHPSRQEPENSSFIDVVRGIGQNECQHRRVYRSIFGARKSFI